MARDAAQPGGRAVTALPILEGHQRAARWRAALDTVAIGLPVVLIAIGSAWRLIGVASALGIGTLGLTLLGLFALRRAHRFDQGWLIGALDARVPGFEDSSGLLFRDTRGLGGLAALQRDRLEARVAQVSAVDLRPGWSRRPIVTAWAMAIVLTAAILIWPAPGQTLRSDALPAQPTSPAGPPAITGARLRIVPPAYTGLPAREQRALDARVPEGSRIEWTIGFAPHPVSATLAFPEDGTVGLDRDGEQWAGHRLIDRSMLYRIEAPALARQRLHRIDAVADAAPVVQIVSPNSQLIMVTPGQRRWTPVFEASDDYGVAEVASLRITVTQGTGENITFVQRSTTLRGTGGARQKRYSTTLDLAREGMAAGSDMIVQLVVSDNRAPERQEVEGPSVILRWPSDLALADGLDGMMMPVTNAYFRSQRQIIIDAEALIAERPRPAAERFLDRSNSLGADQSQLRLRYGQFMGEEAEGGGSGGLALPTNDAPARPALPTSDRQSPAAPAHDDHGHDHADDADSSAPTGAQGSAVDVMGEFGHLHDTGDAATLFDPGTRSTLSLALDAMWSSERALRQGRPAEALPFAYQALEFLKEAQQASRIFLPRTGSNLPPVDLSRRLTGERDGIVADAPEPVARGPGNPTLAAAWRALDGRPATPGSPPLRLDALDRWIRANGGRLADPLALRAAIDTVRDEPSCLPCRARLRALLWSAIERPSATVRRRETPGARGQRYLDALR